MTQFDRNQLADMVLVSFTRQAKTGRRKRFEIRGCAAVARQFYLEWKDANRRNGINDWGHGDEMKDEACRVAIEHYRVSLPGLKGDPPVTLEEIRALMERPAGRRE